MFKEKVQKLNKRKFKQLAKVNITHSKTYSVRLISILSNSKLNNYGRSK